MTITHECPCGKRYLTHQMHECECCGEYYCEDCWNDSGGCECTNEVFFVGDCDHKELMRFTAVEDGIQIFICKDVILNAAKGWSVRSEADET